MMSALVRLAFERGKGKRDRVSVLHGAVATGSQYRFEKVRQRDDHGLKIGGGYVRLPGAFAGTCSGASRRWGWQWVSPANRRIEDRETGELLRHDLRETVIQRAVKEAVARAEVPDQITCPHLPVFLRNPSVGRDV